MHYVKMLTRTDWNGIRTPHTLCHWAGLGLLLGLLLGVHQNLQAQESPALEPVFTRLSTELVRYFPPVTGDIIRVQQGQLYVSLDRQDEVWPGLQLSVYREGGPLKHPTSGAVLGRVEEPLGAVTIVQVAEHYTIAKPVHTERAGAIQSGDKVRLTAGRIPLGLLPLAGSPPAGLTAAAFHDQLRRGLAHTQRFRPLAASRARVWLLQRGVTPGTALTPTHRQELATALQTPYLLQPYTRTVQGQLALELNLFTPDQPRPVAVAATAVPQRSAERVPSAAPASKPVPPAPTSSVSPPAAPSVAVTPSVPAPKLPSAPPVSPSPSSQTAALPPSSDTQNRFEGLFRQPLENPSGPLPLNLTERMVEIHRVAGQLIGLDAGDIDGDGITEVLTLTKSRISLYQLKNQKLVLIDAVKTSRQGTLISAQFLRLGEASPLGIVVNHQVAEAGMDAFILSLQDGKLGFWQQHVYETLLAVDSDGDGINDRVWGQALDEEKFFRRSWVRRYRPGKQQLEFQDVLVIPYAFRATGAALAQLQDKSVRQLVFVDEKRRLQIYRDQEKMWESPTHVGGSYAYAELPQTGELDIQIGEVLKQAFPFEPIPATVDIDGDGIEEVLVVRNDASWGGLLPNRTQFRSGDVAMLRAGPYGYSLSPISPEFDGTVSGLAIAPSRQPSVFVAVTKSQGFLGQKQQTIVFLSRLSDAS